MSSPKQPEGKDPSRSTESSSQRGAHREGKPPQRYDSTMDTEVRDQLQRELNADRLKEKRAIPFALISIAVVAVLALIRLDYFS